MSITQELVKSINSQLSPAKTCRLKILEVETPPAHVIITLPIWLLHLGNSFIFFWANILDTIYHICSWDYSAKAKEKQNYKKINHHIMIYIICMCIKPKVLEAHLLTYVQCPCKLHTWSENRDCSTLYIRNACKNDTQNHTSLITCLMHRPTFYVAPNL